MTEAIIVELITGGCYLAGVIIGCVLTNRKTKKDIKATNEEMKSDIKEEFRVAQAVTETKIEELTREVREHNNFAKRMPVVERDIVHIEEDIKDLKKFHER